MMAIGICPADVTIRMGQLNLAGEASVPEQSAHLITPLEKLYPISFAAIVESIDQVSNTTDAGSVEWDIEQPAGETPGKDYPVGFLSMRQKEKLGFKQIVSNWWQSVY